MLERIYDVGKEEEHHKRIKDLEGEKSILLPARERVKYRASPEGINFEKLFIRFLSLINSDSNLVNAHHKGNIIENQVVGN